MTLACRFDYHEHIQKAWSLQAQSNIEMTGTNRYQTAQYGNVTVPPVTSSENFKTSQPVRGYSNSIQTRYVPEASINQNYVNKEYDIKSTSNPGTTSTTTNVGSFPTTGSAAPKPASTTTTTKTTSRRFYSCSIIN